MNVFNSFLQLNNSIDMSVKTSVIVQLYNFISCEEESQIK